MFEKIARLSVEHRGIVLAATLFLAVAGLWAAWELPLDAVPDVTNNQVQINTEVSGMGPVEVEKLVTFPLESEMSGLPGVAEVRSLSKYGLSQVTIVFDDGVDIYFARQLVNERLQDVRGELPAQLGLNPTMAPVSTGLGEIFQYTLVRDPDVPPAEMIRDVQRHVPGFDPGRPDDPESLRLAELMALRAVQDWIIRYRLLATPGVVEVNAFGGHVRQYQVWIDPARLVAYDLTVADVFAALEDNNANAGGAYLERGGEYALIRGEGLIESLAEIEDIVLLAEAGTPVTVGDVATVVFAGEVRAGAATQDGRGEVVLGVVMMLKDANARKVTAAIKERLPGIRAALPDGVDIDVFYDRQEFVDRTIHTALKNLVEGALLVVIVLYLVLGNLRGSLIVAAVIPLAMLFALICMVQGGISGNLMSLGAIDFGILIDGGVVMVENSLRLLHRGSGGRRRTVMESCAEVARPVAFGVTIVLIVYLPVFALEGIEGKLFRPLAYTVVFALLGALIAALTVIPALSSLFLRAQRPRPGVKAPAPEGEDPAAEDTRLVAWIRRGYRPALDRALRAPALVLSVAAGLFAASLLLFGTLGSVFTPKLDEGAIAMQVVRPPANSLTQTVRVQTVVESILRSIPEVETVVSKSGRPELATDPMGPEISDVYVMLEPRSEWRAGLTKDALVAEMQSRLAVVPGANFAFSQPIELRVNELISGVRSDVAVKVFGPDLDELNRIAAEIAGVLGEVPGAVDVQNEQTTGLPVLNLRLDRHALARYGLNVAEVNQLIEIGLGGGVAGQVLEGDARYDLVARLEPSARDDVGSIGNLLLEGAGGEHVPLRTVADITLTEGPAQVVRENASRRQTVEFNVRGRDIASVVAEAQARLAEVSMPPGYFLDWGGQFENLERARARLNVMIPIALLLIAALLYLALEDLKHALLIFVNVPFAVSGGIVALWLRGLPFSVSAGIGFIIVSGIAVLNSLVMVSTFQSLRREGRGIDQVVRQGVDVRLRPILMTALTDIVGFLPMAMSRSAGAEVQQPLATVVIGGMVSASFLTLFVVPVIYRLAFREGEAVEAG